MKSKGLRALLILFTLFCFSCNSYKHVPYFQDLDSNSITREDIKNYSPLIVQPGDILGIYVTSANDQASAVFNFNLNREDGENSNRSPQNAVVGHLVDAKGNIKLPQLGEIKVSGYTTTEIAELLQVKLSALLTKPLVSIRIMNFKISVMGDVLHPDVFSITNERITIPEALSLAGDLNITGVRNKILLIREFAGKREFIPIDLESKTLFESPYYYLKNNDVIYVTPNKEKVAASSTNYQKVSLVIAAISVIAIVLANSHIKL